jgi:hypothetical protein
MEGRSSPARLTVPKLNDGEGVAFLVREAALKLKEAPGPTHGERGGVRWLGTDRAVENRGGVAAIAYCNKTTSEIRGLSPKIISGDSR